MPASSWDVHGSGQCWDLTPIPSIFQGSHLPLAWSWGWMVISTSRAHQLGNCRAGEHIQLRLEQKKKKNTAHKLRDVLGSKRSACQLPCPLSALPRELPSPPQHQRVSRASEGRAYLGVKATRAIYSSTSAPSVNNWITLFTEVKHLFICSPEEVKHMQIFGWTGVILNNLQYKYNPFSNFAQSSFN